MYSLKDIEQAVAAAQEEVQRATAECDAADDAFDAARDRVAEAKLAFRLAEIHRRHLINSMDEARAAMKKVGDLVVSTPGDLAPHKPGDVNGRVVRPIPHLSDA